MKPNTAIGAAGLTLPLESVPDDQSVAGDPRTGARTLTEFGGLDIGVWEMTPGTMTDVEADEVFVVLSGAATVEFADGTPDLHLRAGDVGRLAAGTETTWTVTKTLRKVYLT